MEKSLEKNKIKNFEYFPKKKENKNKIKNFEYFPKKKENKNKIKNFEYFPKKKENKNKIKNFEYFPKKKENKLIKAIHRNQHNIITCSEILLKDFSPHLDFSFKITL